MLETDIKILKGLFRRSGTNEFVIRIIDTAFRIFPPQKSKKPTKG